MNNQPSYWFSLSCAVALAAAAAACAGKLENPEDFTTGGGGSGTGGSGTGGSGTGGSAGVGTGGSGTGGSAGSEPMQAFNPPACAAAVFKTCATTSVCHSGAATAAQGLHLDAMSLMNPANYTNVAPKGEASDPSSCKTGKIVDPAAPAQSLLYTKLMPTPPCGTKMPIGPALTGDQIACVLQWIQSIPGVAGGGGTGGAGGSGGTGGAGGGTGGAGGATGGAGGASGAGGGTGGAGGGSARDAGMGGGPRDAGGGTVVRDAGAGGGNVVRDAARGG